MGLRGVPHFVINDEAAFSGALPPDSFLQILTQYYENWKKNQDISVDVAGERCDIDGNCD